jgi:hypothetical protein
MTAKAAHTPAEPAAEEPQQEERTRGQSDPRTIEREGEGEHDRQPPEGGVEG